MKTEQGIDGGTLKWIAIITMAIDHLGASLLEVFVLNGFGTSPLGGYFYEPWEQIYQVDRIIRLVGRIAFPIFCFLLVEGFLHTRNVKKYAVRLGLFALVSEIPFNLAVRNRLLFPEHQNVFFTLLIGLLVIWAMKDFSVKERTLQGWIRAAAVTVAGSAAAELLGTDYGVWGVLLIVILYVLRENRTTQCLAGAALFSWEYTAPLAFVPIWFYNGKRGRQHKWFFYWFYPVHLLLYYLIGGQLLPRILLG